MRRQNNDAADPGQRTHRTELECRADRGVASDRAKEEPVEPGTNFEEESKRGQQQWTLGWVTHVVQRNGGESRKGKRGADRDRCGAKRDESFSSSARSAMKLDHALQPRMIAASVKPGRRAAG